ncbi:MAG: hypothetical protein IIC10_05615 [Proteobacteria bacterium]|nr:hypothetical protein [Pseudomonadota bacterium]
MLLLTGTWMDQGRGLVLIEPTHLATVSALAALTILHKGKWHSAALVFGGMMGAVWINALVTSGYPGPLVTVAVCLVAAIAFFCAVHEKDFAPRQLRDEGLLLVFAVSLVVSIVPAAFSGWQTASNLQSLDAGQNETYASVGVLILSLAFLVLGGIYGKWKDR